MISRLIFFTLLFFLISSSSPTQQEPVFHYLIFTPHCYNVFFQQMDFFKDDCLKLTLSKFLGYGLVVGGAIVKIPQLIKILLNSSVYGISFQSIVLEGLTNWVTIVYSWYRDIPFSIFGENVFILVQNLLIMIFFIIYSKNSKLKYIVPLAAFLIGMGATSEPKNWPVQVINATMYLQMLLFSSSRITQIYEISKCKSTGSLSFITAFLVFIGNLARLFTIMVEADNDMLLKISVILASFLNGIIMAQFIMYWNNKGKEKQQ